MDGSSLESQEAACRKYAVEKGFEIARVYHEVFSGASLLERPKLYELREGVRRGYYNSVISYAVDRLSRSITHLYILLDDFERYNVSAHFVTDTLDNSPEGKLLQSVKGYTAEIERLKILERTTRGKRTHAVNGSLSFKRNLYGYILDESGVRVPTDFESEIVRGMFRAVMEGRSLRYIARSLTERGIPTPRGSSIWFPQNVRTVLTNPAYCGRTVAFRTKHNVFYREGKKVRHGCVLQDPSQHVIMPNVTPPLVSVEEWEHVQAALQRNKQSRGRPNSKEFLLRGLVRCAACGRMYSPVTKSKWRYYVCTSNQHSETRCGTKSFPADKAEQLVWDQVCKIIRGWDPPKPEKEVDPLPAIEKQKEKLVLEQVRIVKRSGSVDDATWKLFEAELIAKKKELDKLEEQRQEILRQRSHRPVVSLDDIRARYADRLDSLPFAGRTELLKLLGIQFLWDGETLQETR